MFTGTQLEPNVVEYTIPGGCVVCGSDLPVRVTPEGARGVCTRCGWFARPTLSVNHKGLTVQFEAGGKA